MKVTRVLHPLFERVPGVPWWAMAWQSGPFCHVRRPFDRFFFAKARHAHELGHVIGEGHDSPLAFTMRSPIALRFFWRNTAITRWQAEHLMANGEVEVAPNE